jgi:hypothetical protein
MIGEQRLTMISSNSTWHDQELQNHPHSLSAIIAQNQVKLTYSNACSIHKDPEPEEEWDIKMATETNISTVLNQVSLWKSVGF